MNGFIFITKNRSFLWKFIKFKIFFQENILRLFSRFSKIFLNEFFFWDEARDFNQGFSRKIHFLLGRRNFSNITETKREIHVICQKFRRNLRKVCRPWPKIPSFVLVGSYTWDFVIISKYRDRTSHECDFPTIDWKFAKILKNKFFFG